MTANITDLVDSSLNYTVLKYATQLTNNLFKHNHSGMKGTAVGIFRLNELQVKNNTFFENGPVTTFSEVEESTYQKYFARGARNLTMNLPVVCNLNYSNEFDYVEKCVDAGHFIDMPAVKGALHIKHCLNNEVCQLPVNSVYILDHYSAGKTLADLLEILEEFKKKHQVSVPYNRALVSQNTFENNQVLPPMHSQ